MVENMQWEDTQSLMKKTWDRSQIKLKKTRSERKSFKSTIQHENYLGPACNNRYFKFVFSPRLPTIISVVKHCRKPARYKTV